VYLYEDIICRGGEERDCIKWRNGYCFFGKCQCPVNRVLLSSSTIMTTSHHCPSGHMQLLGFFFLAFSNSQILLLSPVSRVFGCILYLLVEIKCGCVSLISRITVSRVYGRLVFGAWHSGRSTLFLPLICYKTQ